MQIDLYKEIKQAIKDALTEWYQENKKSPLTEPVKNEEALSLLTVKQFAKKYPFTTESSLRHILFSRDYNKFNKCISTFGTGRSILIKEKEALDWFTNPPKEARWTYNQNKYKES